MKAHIGVDADSGLVHTVRCTSGHVNDATQAHRLLHGQEETVWADAGYQGVEAREGADPNVTGHVAMRPGNRKVPQARKSNGRAVEQGRKAQSGQSGQGGTPVSGDQETVLVHEDPLPGIDEERGAECHAVALSNLWMARHDLMGARAMFDPVSVRQAWQRARKEASTLDAVLVAQSGKSLDEVLSKLGDAFHYPVCRLNSELALLPDLAMLGLPEARRMSALVVNRNGAPSLLFANPTDEALPRWADAKGLPMTARELVLESELVALLSQLEGATSALPGVLDHGFNEGARKCLFRSKKPTVPIQDGQSFRFKKATHSGLDLASHSGSKKPPWNCPVSTDTLGLLGLDLGIARLMVDCHHRRVIHGACLWTRRRAPHWHTRRLVHRCEAPGG